MTLNALLKSNARTLYLSAKILPRNIRPAFTCAYLLCRAADSIADVPSAAAGERAALIKTFPAVLGANGAQIAAQIKMYAMQNFAAAKQNAERDLLLNIDTCAAAYHKLSPAHQTLTSNILQTVCAAMEWDLTFFPAENSGLIKAVATREQTIDYCDKMGGAPGAFWAALLLNGRQDSAFTDDARAIGRALQITNILRDIAADAAISRCYLPLADLTANDLMPQDLLDKKTYKKLRPAALKWISWGADSISRAPAFIAQIPRRHIAQRASVLWPVLWCLDTLTMLAAARNLLDKNHPVKIPKNTIYKTVLLTPFYAFSNTVVQKLIARKLQNLRGALR